MGEVDSYRFVTCHRWVCTEGVVISFGELKIGAHVTFRFVLNVSPVSVPSYDVENVSYGNEVHIACALHICPCIAAEKGCFYSRLIDSHKEFCLTPYLKFLENFGSLMFRLAATEYHGK